MKNKKKLNGTVVIWGVFIVVVLGFVGVLISLSFKINNSSSSVETSPKNYAQNAFMITKDGVVDPTTDPGSAEKVYLYVDPICPGCGYFDRELAPTFDKMLKDGKIVLYVTPLTFLDNASTDNYSTRAAAALTTVAEYAPKYFMPFVSALFENQPEEGSNYQPVSNDELALIAENVGVPKETVNKIKEGKFEKWVKENSRQIENDKNIFPDGVITPTLILNLYKNDGTLNDDRVNADFQTDLPLNVYVENLINNSSAAD